MKLPLIISLSIMGGIANAAQIDADQALAIARQIYSEFPDQTLTSNVQLEIVAQDMCHAQPVYYVCQPKNGEGYIIVSGNDQEPELLGYSTTGSYQKAIQLVPFAEMLSNYADVVSNEVLHDNVTRHNASRRQATAVSKIINPLCKSFWHQNEPYWNLCPMQDSARCLVGCTAVAMAQVMYYHKFPTNPTGTGSATMAHTPLPSIDFSEYTFDWDNMLDTYKDVSYTEDQANAVATLCMICGYGANMNYSSEGSGAYYAPARRALVENFGYSTTARIYSRQSYSKDNWLEKIREELNAGRPILYSGTNESGSAHAFVCDGMGLRNTIHINWGWGEGWNANLDCDVLTPSGSSEGYTINNEVIMGIQPAQEGEDRTLPYNFDVCDSVKYKVSNNMIVIPGIWNYNTSSKTVNVGFSIFQNGETVEHAIVKKSVRIESEMKSNPIYAILKLPTLADGTYTLHLGVQIPDEDDWTEVNAGDMLIDLQFTVADGVVSYDGYVGISEVIEDRVATNSSHIYDYSGRSVKEMQPNKIYIVNGKPITTL